MPHAASGVGRKYAGIWPPPPDSRVSAYPQIPAAVFIQGDYKFAEASALPVTLHMIAVNGAEPALRFPGPARSPHRSFVILQEREDIFSVKFRVVGQLAVLPTGQPFTGSYPKPAISRGYHAPNRPAGEMLRIRRLPWRASHTVESLQAKCGTEPQVAVGRLRNGVDRAFEKTLADRPCFVLVLIDIEGRIQAERPRARNRKQDRKNGKSSLSDTVHFRFIISFPPARTGLSWSFVGQAIRLCGPSSRATLGRGDECRPI